MKNDDLTTMIENPLKEVTATPIQKVLKGNKALQTKKMQKVERKLIKKSEKDQANKAKKQTNPESTMKKVKSKMDNNSQSVADELAKLLADENILYIKTKNAHWNVEGEDFYDKHKLFEIQFGLMDCSTNSRASRANNDGMYRH